MASKTNTRSFYGLIRPLFLVLVYGFNFKGREVDETWREVCSFCFVYNFKIYNRVLSTKTALTKLLENTRYDSSKLKNMPHKRLGCPTKSLLKLVSAVFYQIFIFHQIIALQKLGKMFFNSSKKRFLLLRYLNFCIFVFPSFPCQPLL